MAGVQYLSPMSCNSHQLLLDLLVFAQKDCKNMHILKNIELLDKIFVLCKFHGSKPKLIKPEF